MENIEQPLQNLDDAQSRDEGSMLGKFKDATSLLNAYKSLQAEFTRKSQKLAELQKQNFTTEMLSQEECASKEENSVSSENSTCDENFIEINNFDAILSQRLLNFAENEPDAIADIPKIKEEILNYKNLADTDEGIRIAYRLVKEKEKVDPAQISTNPELIEKYILSNEQITNAVVDKYIKSLATQVAAPKIISNASASVLSSPNQRPQTLSEANKIFSKMLENK